MYQDLNIPEFKSLPDLTYRSLIAYRILEREKGYSIPIDDDYFLKYLSNEVSNSTEIESYMTLEGLSKTEIYVYRQVQGLFSTYIKEEIQDEFFIACLEAATHSHFSGFAPYSGFGIYSPFYHTCIKFGKSEAGHGLPWDKYSYYVSSFFLKGLSKYLEVMPYKSKWESCGN